jgi:hypothetical protein
MAVLPTTRAFNRNPLFRDEITGENNLIPKLENDPSGIACPWIR